MTDTAFRHDLEAVFHRAAEAGVTRMVTIASDLDDALRAAELAAARSRCWSTAGVHPHAAGDASPDTVAKLRGLLAHDDVVAVGETGLDYHYDNAAPSVQRALFDAHLALGAETGLPVVVHAREADDDIAAALRNMPAGTRGVLHCFTGGDRAFGEAMAAGWWVSFSGIASFKSFGAVDLLREVPEDRLMVETDSPYLAPVPHRGRRNEPAHVVHVAEAVASLLDRPTEEVARRTSANACTFYGVE
ncbi:MAG: TatD family hydrolase [Gemmatimonadetes bacterium]|nr:TatD family hydrolase [Gemmatimonadota bacterium]NNF13635.1 TatD family hydrolase [Gemmatimonadota bacterium]